MSSTSRKVRGEWLVLAAAVLWGTTGTAQALAPETATSLGIGALRLAIGGSAMLVIAFINGSFATRRPWPRRTTLLAAVFVASYQVLFFSGVAAAGVAIGTIVGIGSSPLLTGALGWLLTGEKPDRRWFAATLLAIVGCTLLALSGGALDFHPAGILFALGAGLCYAFYAINSKRLMNYQPPDAVMAVLFSLGGLLLSPALFLVELSWVGEVRGLAVALHLGLVTTALANIMFGRGLRSVPAAHAVTLSLAEPLTAGLLGVFLLGEVLAPLAWVGVFLILGGLALLAR